MSLRDLLILIPQNQDVNVIYERDSLIKKVGGVVNDNVGGTKGYVWCNVLSPEKLKVLRVTSSYGVITIVVDLVR